MDIKFLSGNDFEQPWKPSSNQMMVNQERLLTDWIEAADRIDRVKELADIVARAVRKDDDPATATIKEDSPLKTLAFMGKAIKRSNRLTVTGALKRTKTKLKRRVRSGSH